MVIARICCCGRYEPGWHRSREFEAHCTCAPHFRSPARHPILSGPNQYNRPHPFLCDSSRGQKRKATNAVSGIHPGYGLRGLLVSGPAAFRQWQHLCSCWWCPSAWVCSWTCAPASCWCSCPSWLWVQPSWLCSCSCFSLSWQHIFASPPGYFLTLKISICPGAVNGSLAHGARVA
jgi:hypothetical protein